MGDPITSEVPLLAFSAEKLLSDKFKRSLSELGLN